ncbi:MAG: hypothetical protein RJB66_232 [Pseudomonadota bacterium]|jgi:hypothetical protein
MNRILSEKAVWLLISVMARGRILVHEIRKIRAKVVSLYVSSMSWQGSQSFAANETAGKSYQSTSLLKNTDFNGVN